MRLYHPELKKTIDVPDDDDAVATLAKSGWGKTIPAEHSDPAVAADQPDVTYQPVAAESKAKRSTRSSPKGAESTD